MLKSEILTPFIGGDLQVIFHEERNQETRKKLRGPIKAIWNEGKLVFIQLEWVGNYDFHGETWHASEEDRVALPQQIRLNMPDIADRLLLSADGKSYALFLPRGPKLAREKVQGLS